MRRFILLLSMLSALTAAWPAAAERGGREGYGRDGGQRQQQQREDRYVRKDEYQRRNEDRHREQLSPEQREQLRRDIYDHGREIYRDRRDQR
ncbi:MAG TPA: hypothetical protein VJU83_12375 [Burkholderiales bacterium]|nr:hypothetical protein [Burkholderiales bacterium]